jgi:heptaprenyl diphosphate synthase
VGTLNLRDPRTLARLALLAALGAVLGLVERQFPPPVPVPGVRLGLANAATLIALLLDGPAAGLAVWGLRLTLVGLLSGGIFSPGFWVGASGGLCAWAAMGACVRFAPGRPRGARRKTGPGPAGVSVVGAVAHHLGQLTAVSLLTGSPAVFALLPALVALGTPVGFLTGLLADLLISRLRLALGEATAPAPAIRPRPADLVLGAGTCALAALLWLLPWAPSAAGPATAGVTVAGQTVLRLDLRQDRSYQLAHMQIEVRGGAVRVTESDCPDQVCVHTGWISRPGGVIVCAPNRTVIRLTGGPDAVLR